MSDEKVPMTPECLRMVPLYARVEWRDETGETSMPVGQMCHQAADTLEQAQTNAADRLGDKLIAVEKLRASEQRIGCLEAALRKIAITQYYRDDDLGEHMRIAEEVLESVPNTGQDDDR